MIDSDESNLFTGNDHRQSQQLHVHQAAIPACALCRDLYASFLVKHAPIPHSLVVDRFVLGYHILQVAADHLLTWVLEQLLGHWVPGDNVPVHVAGDHGNRVVDKERLEILLLAADLFLELLALGDLLQASFVVEYLSIFSLHGSRRIVGPDGGAIAPVELSFEIPNDAFPFH